MGGFANVADKEVLDNAGDRAATNASANDGKGDAGKGDGGKDVHAEIRELREQLKQREKLLSEVSASERHWYQQATSSGKKQEPEEREPEERELEIKDDSPERLVEELSTAGIKALEKRGVITRKEARELVRTEAAKIAKQIAKDVVSTERVAISRDAELMQEYPELRDQSSPLFQKAGEIFRAMVERNPDAAKDGESLLRAAREAKLLLRIEALESGRRENADDRDARIRAQGDRGRRSGDSFSDDQDDDRMTPRQKAIAAAMGVSDEDYMRTARAGINVSRRTAGGRR